MSLPTLNWSILSVPAFYMLAFAPHSYAVSLSADGKGQRTADNRSPRSVNHKENIRKTLDPVKFARYERAEAASANAYENIPLLVAAVLAGNLAGLPKERMNRFALGFLAARAGHTLFYINITSQKYSYLRSICWMTSLALSFGVLYEAAVKLA